MYSKGNHKQDEKTTLRMAENIYKPSNWQKTNLQIYKQLRTSLVAQMVKASAYNEGDVGSIPGLGRLPGEGNGYPFWYSCLENPMDGGAW